MFWKQLEQLFQFYFQIRGDNMFMLLAGGLLIIIVAVIVAVVSAVTSAVAASEDIED